MGVDVLDPAWITEHEKLPAIHPGANVSLSEYDVPGTSPLN